MQGIANKMLRLNQLIINSGALRRHLPQLQNRLGVFAQQDRNFTNGSY